MPAVESDVGGGVIVADSLEGIGAMVESGVVVMAGTTVGRGLAVGDINGGGTVWVFELHD